MTLCLPEVDFMAQVAALRKSLPSEFALIACLALAPQVASAEWSGKAEGGLALANGNTNNDTANLKTDMQWKLEPWQYQLGATGIYASDDTGTTGERWEIRGQSKYHFEPKTFWFNSGRYEHDRFSGFRYQAILGTGVGRDFFDTETVKLSAQIGVGYKFFETRNTLAEDGSLIEKGEKDDEIIYQFSTSYEQALTETTKLLDKFLVETGPENTFLQNDLALQVKINSVLALALGYSVRHNTKPPEGFRRTDTLTTANLVFEFK